MQTFRQKSVQYLLALVFFGLAFHAPMTVLVSTHFEAVSLIAKSWKEIVLLLVFGLLVWQISLQKLWPLIARDRLVQLVAAYAAIHLLFVVGLYFSSTKSLLAGLEIDLRGALVFCETYVAIRYLWPSMRGPLLRAIALASVVIVGFAVGQLFLPRDFLAHFGYSEQTIRPFLTVDKAPGLTRENSTLRGPNPLGAYAASLLLFLAAWWYVRKATLDTRAKQLSFYGLGIASVIALVVSYSRSAWLGFLCALVAAIVFTLRTRAHRGTWIAMAIVVCASIGGLFALRSDPTVSTIFFHNNPNGSSVKSDDQHAASLAEGAKTVLTHPLGLGIGSAGSASLLSNKPTIVENQYLFVAYEAGWLGLVCFVAVFGMILYRAYCHRQEYLVLGVLLSGICLGIIGLMLPVFTDDVIMIMWWGIAGIALAGVSSGGTIKAHGRSKSSYQKTKANA